MEEKRRTIYFSAPGMRNQELEIAPEAIPPSSKREDIIREEDYSLDSNIKNLDVETRTRNRIFQERLDAIWKNTADWEAHLRIEAQEAAETICTLRDNYENHLNKFEENLIQNIENIFNEFHVTFIPKEKKRIDESEENFKEFETKIVPDKIEEQTGVISRQLKRIIETFEIEKKKNKKENKLILRAAHHFQNTSQRLEDESAFLSSSFFTVEDDIIEYERREARRLLIREANAIKKRNILNEVLEKEVDERISEDKEVLDTVLETQNLLQQMILMHFGTRSDDKEYIEMNKLKKRLELIEDRKKRKEEREKKKLEAIELENKLKQEEIDNEKKIQEELENNNKKGKKK